MARNKSLNVRFTENEYNELQYLSDNNGISMSDLIRQSVKSNLNKSGDTYIGCNIYNNDKMMKIDNLSNDLRGHLSAFPIDDKLFIDVNYEE